VPLIDGLLGASIPKLTWFGAIVSLIGIGLLECGGSPPCVSNQFIFCTGDYLLVYWLLCYSFSRSYIMLKALGTKTKSPSHRMFGHQLEVLNIG